MEENSTGKPATNLHKMLGDKEHPSLEKAVQLALADGKVLKGILDGIVAKDDAYRYNCFKVLLQISENQPLVLYPEWGYFVELLESSNAYHRSTALQLVANLTSVDEENRFEDIFDQYFDLLNDEKVMTARYLARSAGRIAISKPHLQARITERLLGIDGTHHAQGRKDLIKADIIQSFEEFFEDAGDKEEILAFVENQLGCSSPKTRKAAKAFLNNKYGK
jgi:hypothetical protein